MFQSLCVWKAVHVSPRSEPAVSSAALSLQITSHMGRLTNKSASWRAHHHQILGDSRLLVKSSNHPIPQLKIQSSNTTKLC